jgi:hypothetical protein
MNVVHFYFLQPSKFSLPLDITQRLWMKLPIALE